MSQSLPANGFAPAQLLTGLSSLFASRTHGSGASRTAPPVEPERVAVTTASGAARARRAGSRTLVDVFDWRELRAPAAAFFLVLAAGWVYAQFREPDAAAESPRTEADETAASAPSPLRFTEEVDDALLPELPPLDEILSPDAEPVGERPDAPFAYELRPGDSLGKLAQRFGCSVDELKRANKLGSDRIVAGRSLLIPVCGSSPAGAAEPVIASTNWRESGVDSKTLPRLMRARGFSAPSGFKAFVISVRFDEDRSRVLSERAYDWNGSSDDSDGWNPASSVKLFAAIAALQKTSSLGFSPDVRVTFHGRRTASTSLRQLVNDAIVASDNIAYDRLVQLVGFDELNERFLSSDNGLPRSALTRAYEQKRWTAMGESASFRSTPALSLVENELSAELPATTGNARLACQRAACTTLQDLAEAMRRLMLQEQLGDAASFALPQESLQTLRRALRSERARGNEMVDAFASVLSQPGVQFYSKPGYSESWYSDTVYVFDPSSRHGWIVAMAGYPGRHSLDEAARIVAEIIAAGELDGE